MINLKPLYDGETDLIEFSFLRIPADIPADIKFSIPVACNGRVFARARGRNSTESFFELKIKLHGSYKTICSRCAADIERNFNLEQTFTVAESVSSEENDEIIVTKNQSFDAEEFCDSMIILNLPSINLCKDDCLGLCAGCGANLNFEKCSCSKKNIDPRLAILQKLLDKE